MPKPKKEPADRAEIPALDPQQPLPVKLIQDPPVNPYEGKFPREGDPIEKRKYHFSYNQQPGTPLEFTKGRTVLKGNGRPGTVHESYCLEDDSEYELPVDVAKHLNSLKYHEGGRPRPRCTLVEVD